MFERIVSQHEAITTTPCLLDKPQMCLSTDERDTILEAITLLKPFLQATEQVSGEQYISISLIIPLTRLLLHSCTQGPNTVLQQNLVQEMNKRFNRIEQRYTLAVAILLDPRFKKIGFANASAIDQAVKRLQGDVKAMIEREGQQTQQDTDESSSTGSNTAGQQTATSASTSSDLWGGLATGSRT